MNEREQQTIERIGNQIMVTLSCHWTPKNFREYLDGKLSELWQAALSAAAPNNGTYCIHGIKCALCADGISPAGTGQPQAMADLKAFAVELGHYASGECYQSDGQDQRDPDKCNRCYLEQLINDLEGGDSVKGEGETAPPTLMGMRIETDVTMPPGQIDISDAKGRRPAWRRERGQ